MVWGVWSEENIPVLLLNSGGILEWVWFSSFTFSSCSVTKLWTTACQAPVSSTISQSLLKFMSLSWWCYLTISSSATPFSSCPQSFPAQGLFQWIGPLHQVAKVLELQFQDKSFQWIFRVGFLSDWPVWSPCSPRESQEFSPAPRLKSITSSVLSLLYHPTLTFIHDYWKNHSLEYTYLCQQSDVSAF